MLVDAVRVMDAFTRDMDVANSAVLFYSRINTQLNLAKSATYVAVTLVLDGLIVYRTFIVWSRSFFVVIPPFVLFVADIGLCSSSAGFHFVPAY